MKWKPTAADKKTIREFAARSEKRKPLQLHIEIGERYSLTRESGYADTNVLLVDNTPDWEESDLSQTWPWAELKWGIRLTKEGRAVVDFYVYEKEFGDHGDLMTNVQAHVALKDGKPVLWKMTGTGVPAQILDSEIEDQLKAEPVGADG